MALECSPNDAATRPTYATSSAGAHAASRYGDKGLMTPPNHLRLSSMWCAPQETRQTCSNALSMRTLGDSRSMREKQRGGTSSRGDREILH